MTPVGAYSNQTASMVAVTANIMCLADLLKTAICRNEVVAMATTRQPTYTMALADCYCQSSGAGATVAGSSYPILPPPVPNKPYGFCVDINLIKEGECLGVISKVHGVGVLLNNRLQKN